MSKATRTGRRGSSRRSARRRSRRRPRLQELLERSHVAGPRPRRPVRRSCAGSSSAPRPIACTRCCSTTRGPRCSEVFGATPPSRQHRSRPHHRRRAPRGDADRRGRRDAARTSRSRRACPASLLTVYLALARLARISGGDVADDDDDSSPLRVDGRAARALRWVDGVAVVTDGQSLCATRGPEAAAGVAVPRSPSRARVADGPYADAALDAGHRGDRASPASTTARSRSRRRRGRRCLVSRCGPTGRPARTGRCSRRR